jgi:hypothetical protein
LGDRGVSGNVGPEATVRESIEDMFHYLDALPQPLRRVLIYAPFAYAVRPWFENYIQCAARASADQIGAEWLRRMRVHRAIWAAKTYGPDHPQARS